MTDALEQSSLPTIRLDIYPPTILGPGQIILHRFQTTASRQVASTVYPVAYTDVVEALADLPTSTGYLPHNTITVGRREGSIFVAIYLPPARWEATVRKAPRSKTYHIPLPGLVFLGHGRRYWVWAVKHNPFQQKPHTLQLFHTPCPNVYENGGICPGNAQWPECAPATVYEAFRVFIQASDFNGNLTRGKSKTYPTNVLHLWGELDGRRRFPAGELVASNLTLNSALTQRLISL